MLGERDGIDDWQVASCMLLVRLWTLLHGKQAMICTQKKFCTPEQGSGLRYANSFLFVYVSVNEYICIVFKDALRGRNLVPIASIEILDGAVLGS